MQLLESCEDILTQMAGSPALLPSGYPCAQSSDAVVMGKADPKTMSVPFVIVTRSNQLNRHGNKVQIVPTADGKHQGMRLDNYKTNPVVLFDHGMSGLPLPIGVSEDKQGNSTIKLFNSKAEGTVFFSQRLPDAVQIYALVDEGILRTASISFLPLKAQRIVQKPGQQEVGDNGEPIMNLQTPWMPLDFLESDMLEWSVVGIPADPGAVRKFLDRGKINTEKLTFGVRQALAHMAEAKPCWAPGWSAPSGQVLVQSANIQMGGLTPPHDLAVTIKDILGEMLNQKFDAAFERLSVRVDQSESQNTTPAVPRTEAVSTDAAHTPEQGISPEDSAQKIAAESQALLLKGVSQMLSEAIAPVKQTLASVVERQSELGARLENMTGKV